MKVHWTNHAIGQLTAIYNHIACDSPRYALAMIERLTSRSVQIGAFPLSGEMVPEYQMPEVREVIESPYRVIYRVHEDEVQVLAVIHGAQQLPSSI